MNEHDAMIAANEAAERSDWKAAATHTVAFADHVGARTVEGSAALIAKAQVYATLHLAETIAQSSAEIQFSMGANAAARGGF